MEKSSPLVAIELCVVASTEIYYLGRITKPLTLMGHVPMMREGDFFITYTKEINPGEDCVETASMRNPPKLGKDNHQYFFHKDYPDVVKRTNHAGEVSRSMRHQTTSLSVSFGLWDADIVDRLRELPAHVRDVYGL